VSNAALSTPARRGRARSVRTARVEPTPATATPGRALDVETPWYSPLPDAQRYWVDLWQRGVLFLDTLRQRADNMLEHERAGLPNVLDFDYEVILDARRFERPANYALLRITGEKGVRAAEHLDPAKRPVIIVDPRAGHGPGIGGFKRDSEVGMALREGHPTYFVIFYPEPCPGQTLADVLGALRRFVEEVRTRHADAGGPVLYGNCQAGWAVAMLSAECAGLSGPAVLNGAPLSYWAGEPGNNPMRVMGALAGGVWLAHLLADLGDGRLDGAWLAQNFENLKPERAIWDKYAELFRNVDDERERFLDFELWWNGFHFLSREEIVAIVENLFIGDRLEQGELRVCPGCSVDLRNIRNPMVIFASSGDNITPPYEALGWIPVVYPSTQALKSAGQRIVYLINPHVGHLGIFVSAKVARLEHRAILEHMEELEGLEPGLYEMKIHNPSGSRDSHRPEYRVRFEPRRVESLRRYSPRGDVFTRVRAASELNEAAYRTWLSPWVRAAVTPASAELLRWLHPMRTSRYVFSERFNPWLRGLSDLAQTVAAHRQPAGEDNAYGAAEAQWDRAVSEGMEALRRWRDLTLEAMFRTTYGE
jgi:hypothetical protein